MYRGVARFFLDAEHNFVLERSAMKYSRLQVCKAFEFVSLCVQYSYNQ